MMRELSSSAYQMNSPVKPKKNWNPIKPTPSSFYSDGEKSRMDGIYLFEATKTRSPYRDVSPKTTASVTGQNAIAWQCHWNLWAHLLLTWLEWDFVEQLSEEVRVMRSDINDFSTSINQPQSAIRVFFFFIISDIRIRESGMQHFGYNFATFGETNSGVTKCIAASRNK